MADVNIISAAAGDSVHTQEFAIRQQMAQAAAQRLGNIRLRYSDEQAAAPVKRACNLFRQRHQFTKGRRRITGKGYRDRLAVC